MPRRKKTVQDIEDEMVRNAAEVDGASGEDEGEENTGADESSEDTQEQDAPPRELPMPMIQKKIKRTEEYSQPMAVRPPLPDANDLSAPEENAIYKIHDITVEEVLDNIGMAGFANWTASVYRVTPDHYEGNRIKQCCLKKLKLPTKYQEMIDSIEEVNGAGRYMIVTRDPRGTMRRKDYFEVDEGLPKFTEAEITSAFKDAEEAGATPVMSDRIRKLREEAEATEIQQQIESIKGSGKGDIQAVANMFSNQMRTMVDVFADMNRENRSMIERMAAKVESASQAPKNDQGWIEALKVLAPIIGTIIAGRGDSSGKQQELLVQTMQSANKTIIDLVANKANGGNEQLEYLKTMAEMVMMKNQNQVDAALKIYEIMAAANGDEDPKVQWMTMISGLLKDGLDVVKLAMAARNQKPLLPAPAQPKAAPQPQAAPAAAPSQPAPKRKTREELLDEIREGANAGFDAALKSGQPDDVIGVVLMTMIKEAALLPPPDECAWIDLALDENAPNFISPWLGGLKDSKDMREKLMAFLPDQQSQAMIDGAVFSRVEQSKWLDDCLAYVRSGAATEDDEPEAAPAPAPVETASEGQADATPDAG